MSFALAASLAASGAWLYLLLGRGGFWRAAERDGGALPPARSAPSVVAVVPARDEAAMVRLCLPTLLAQEAPGPFSVVLVDDGSRDGTADVAAAAPGAAARLTVVAAPEPPPGWTGKLAAVAHGVAIARGRGPDYLLLTDADIAYAPGTLAALVDRAEAGRLALVSLMAKLACDSPAERALVPAFVFFFQMLYPFRWVNDPSSPVAAAAGGVMLVRAEALEAAGGVAAIRGALIDDCALAALMKRQGPIWIGLTDRAESRRPYPRLDDIRRMVARSAYAQLGYSPALLAATVAGLALVYLVPPFATAFASGWAQLAGAAGWAAMALAYQPMLRFYGRSPLWGAALPLVAAAYLAFTLDSAYQHARGRGGMWKGRAQARPARGP